MKHGLRRSLATQQLKKISNKVVTAELLALIFLAVVILLSNLRFKALDQSTAQLSKLSEMELTVQHFIGTFYSMQDNTRDYLLTGHDHEKQEAIADQEKLVRRLKEIRDHALFGNDQVEFPSLEPLLEKKFAYNQATFEAYENQDQEAAMEILEGIESKALDSLLFADLESFEVQKISVTHRLKETYTQSARWLPYYESIILLIIVVIIGFILWSFWKDVNKVKEIETDLIAAREKAEDASRMKEQFIANVSHELRTPMNAVLGFTTHLLKQDLQPDQHQLARHINEAGDQMLTLVNDLLDFSQMSTGNFKLEKTPFNPILLVHSTVNMLSPAAKNKNLGLHFFSGPGIPELVDGDPKRLTQILVNLINNAIKYSQKGNINVRLHVRQTNEEKVQLHFEIEDSGIGIAKEKIQQIFERFEQLDGQLSRTEEGTGLGLAIVKQLVELQNGNIQVESTPGKGSVFLFDIPYLLVDSARKLNSPVQETLLSENTDFDPNKRLLLVEDNPMNTQVVTRYLDDWAIPYDTASNGFDALGLLEKKAYDLILLDIQMPGIDGYEVTRIIRDERLLTTPIVAMTAHNISSEEEGTRSAGMQAYLQKPFQENELRNVLQTYLAIENENENFIQPDLTYLKEITRGRQDRMQELGKIFLTQSELDLSNIQQNLEQEAWKMVRRHAHNMKTTVGFMGFGSSLGNLLNLMEETTQHEAPKEALSDLFEQLQQQTLEAQQWIRMHLSGVI